MVEQEHEQSPWPSLIEASQRSRIHKEALRARAKRSQLPSRRGNMGQILVQLPPELLNPAQGAAQPPAQAHAEQLAELARDLEQEIAGLRIELAEARAQGRAAEVAAEARVAAERVVSDELRRGLEWHRRPWWRRLIGR